MRLSMRRPKIVEGKVRVHHFLQLRFPDNRVAERRWISEVILSRLSDAYQCKSERREDWELSVDNGSGARAVIRMPDAFFRSAAAGWLKPESMPHRPLKKWQPRDHGLEPVLVEKDVPVLYGSGSFSKISSTTAELGVDVFGSGFFMLSRYEELVTPDRDQHDRFPARASVAFQERFLERPIIDEYAEILWAAVQAILPGAARKQSTFRIDLSHDVDRPSRYLFGPLGGAMRSAVGDVLLRGDLLSPLRALWLRRSSPDALHPADPYNTFDWLMDVSERHNLQSTFYFMAGRSNPQFDARYEIGHPAIRKLLRRIHARGHRIGLHPSYECYRDPEQVRREAHALWRVCEEEGIRQDEWGARMHYLRWSCPQTPRALDATGLSRDSSPGYADHIGFRCGTSFAYPFFDVEGGRALGIRIQPLTVMDGTIYGTAYMNKGLRAQARESVARTVSATRIMNGQFSLLWHNSELDEQKKQKLYEAIVQTAATPQSQIFKAQRPTSLRQ